MNFNKEIYQLLEKIGKNVLEILFLGKGEASIVYKVTTDDKIVVLKTALYPERKNKVLREVNIRKDFINKGINCIPPPLYVDETIFRNGAVIYEYIEGTKPIFRDENLIRQMADNVADIHQKKYELISDGLQNVEKLYSSLDQTINMIKTKYLNLLSPSIELAMNQALVELQDKVQENKTLSTAGINALLHGDLTDNFILDKRNKIWLIDWENSEYGDVIGELSYFSRINLNEWGRSIFYNEYQKAFPLTKNIQFEELFTIYDPFFAVFDICWGIDQLDMNLRQNLEPERKIKDLLITAKEWETFFEEQTSKALKEGIESLFTKI